MGKYILKRVLQFIPVFLGVTLILFAMENIVPGDPIKLMAGEKKLDPVTETNLRATYHLIETDGDGNILYDEGGNTIETPLWKRYVLYVNGLLHGDLGTSYQRKGQAVTPTPSSWPWWPSSLRRWWASAREWCLPSSATRSGTSWSPS